MSIAMHYILKDLKREKILQHYEDKNRLIPHELYMQLKASTKCMHCGKKFSGQHPEIHHKIPVSEGGDNTKENLMAVHSKCHKILDSK